MQKIIDSVHFSWQPILTQALHQLDAGYLQSLQTDKNWLPGIDNLLAAFRMPLSSTRYILLGESPYPRAHSANGYAFWDNAVDSLWSESGFSKPVNRATSLRNLLKMLLHARGDLVGDFSQAVIAKLDKSIYVNTASELFLGFMKRGFLLLNASLVYKQGEVPYHAKQWRPFFLKWLAEIEKYDPSIQLISFGQIAKQLPLSDLTSVYAEHPYNISFITNPVVVDFFKPLDLLKHYDLIEHN